LKKEKIMKKTTLVKFLCVFAVVTPLIVTATAAGFTKNLTYKLDKLGLEVSIPSTYDVITQDTPTSSSVFNDLGISGKELVDHFKTNGIYLNAIPKDTSNEEIVFTMTDGVWENLSAFSDTTIKTLASTLISGYEDYGIVVTDYDVYHHSQAKFIKVYFTDEINSVYGLQFYTTYGAKAMNFTMRSYSGELSQKQEETITNIVDSIKYDTDPVSAPAVPKTNSFVYTDADTNTKFTVPANWYEKELSKERENFDVKFVHNYESDLMIFYGSVDLWSQMTHDEKKEFSSREEFNMSLFSELSDYELMQAFSYYSELGQQINKARIVSYNNVEYFEFIISQSLESYGYPIEINSTMLAHYENGWMHLFQFIGTTDSTYFGDFEKLMNSVQFPTIPNATDVGSFASSPDDVDNSYKSISVIVVFLLVVGVIVTVVLYKNNSKHSTVQNYVPDDKNDFEKSNSSASSVICLKCGQALPLDSEFCHICGTRIIKTNEEPEI